MARMVFLCGCLLSLVAYGIAADEPAKVAAKPKAITAKPIDNTKSTDATKKATTTKSTPAETPTPPKPVAIPNQTITKSPIKTTSPSTSNKTAASKTAPVKPAPAKPAESTKPTAKVEPPQPPTPVKAATPMPAATAATSTAPNASPKPSTGGKTYLLRYKFTKGETLRWQVEHQAEVKMSVSGTTQTADTYSKSLKQWKVTQVDRQGRATFIHSVESVQMRQKLTGRQEVTFDSTTDKEAPVGFQDVAKSVGQPLSSITLDPLGKVVSREDLEAAKSAATRHVTIPLPEEPVAIGFQWSMPDDLTVQGRDGQPKKIQRRQQFTLADVKTGIATIKVETQVLTPVADPGIEAQLVQGETNGELRFNIESGRIESQQMDLDKHVVGVQGDASSMHYVTRFTERLLSAAGVTAAKPQVLGPQPK